VKPPVTEDASDNKQGGTLNIVLTFFLLLLLSLNIALIVFWTATSVFLKLCEVLSCPQELFAVFTACTMFQMEQLEFMHLHCKLNVPLNGNSTQSFLVLS
jgi:hypothetical protein